MWPDKGVQEALKQPNSHFYFDFQYTVCLAICKCRCTRWTLDQCLTGQQTFTVLCQVSHREMKYWGNIWAVWSRCLQTASQGSLSGMRRKVCCSVLSTSQGGEETCFLGQGGPMTSKLPVSSNVKLIYPLIKWKTIEMSVHVIQRRAIEPFGGSFDKFFTQSGEIFSFTTHSEWNICLVFWGRW